MFERWATYYDLIYAAKGKDYRSEADRVRRWIAESGSVARAGDRSAHPRLLDVACGTGEHLRHFGEHFEVTGLDQSAPMLAVAKRKLPFASLAEGSMTDFDLGTTYDAVTCLFSSIGYLEDVASLERAISCMTRHLEPGGVLVLEPALDPERLEPPETTTMELDLPIGRLVRTTSGSHRPPFLEILFDYRVESNGASERFTERQPIRLFTRREYRAAFTNAGLEIRFEKESLSGLDAGPGVILGTRPAT